MGQTGTIDEMLEVCGGFGLYQWCLLAVLSFIMLSIGMQILVVTFLSGEPAWKCVSSSPSCNYTGLFSSGSKVYGSRCKLQSGIDWEYDKAFTSVVTEFNLYCGDAYMRRIASSMIFVGWLLGAIIFGALADRFGRKKILFLSVFMMGCSALAGSFAGVLWVFAICRLLTGAGIGGAMLITFTLSTEFSTPRKRGFFGTVLWFFTTFALMLSSLLAYLIRDWRKLSIACSIPSLLVIFFWRVVPESARWLLTHGQIEEAENLFDKIAIRNGKEKPQLKLEIPPNLASANRVTIFELFHTKQLSMYTCLSWFIWFTCSMMYYGVSLSAGHLSGSMYLNFFLLSIVEIPSNILAIWGMNKFGRKPLLIVGFIGSAICLVSAAFFPASNVNKGYMAGRVLFAVLAKLLILMAFDCTYIVSGELFPTTIRNTGLGTSSAFARIGAFSSSYIVWLNDINRALPFGIMGIVALICGGLCFLLPETRNKATEETVAESISSDIVEEVRLESPMSVQDTVLTETKNISNGDKDLYKIDLSDKKGLVVDNEKDGAMLTSYSLVI